MLNILIIALTCLCTVGSFLVALRTSKKAMLKFSKTSMLFVTILLVTALMFLFAPISNASMLDAGINMLNSGDYLGAQQTFEVLGNQPMLLEAKYAYAKQLYAIGDFQSAIEALEELGEYKSSQEYLQFATLSLHSLDSEVVQQDTFKTQQEETYSTALQYYKSGQFFQAINCFSALKDFKDSKEMLEECVKSAREENAHTISAGIRTATAVRNDGSVVFAGYNDSLDFSQWSNIVSVSNLGAITAGLKNDGTVVATGSYNVDVSNWTDIVSISTGERYIIGLKSDGTLVGAGHDVGDGQLQIGGWNNIVAIATGWRHTVGLDADGGIHITGYRSSNQLQEITDNLAEWSNIVAIAAGGGSNASSGTGHTVGLRSDGTVVAVGDNTYGQCNVNDWTGIIAIAAGDWHTVGLRADGTVVSTHPDSNKYPNLYSAACNVDSWNGIVQIDAGCGYTLGLYADGTALALGYNDNGQQKDVENWTDIKIIS